MLEKILSVVFTVINTCLFTDKRLESLLLAGVEEVLGDIAAIERLATAVRESDYSDNVLERGAYKFQYHGKFQDFGKEFAPYVA